MTYASGGLIQAVDYNALAWTNPSVGGQYGMGTGTHGFGQSVTSITLPGNGVVSGGDVTAVQWNALITAINNCLLHEGQAAITPNSVTAGNIITYYSSIAAGSASAYNNTGVTGIALSDGAANTTTFNSSWGAAGSRSLVFTQSLTFASGNHARYFFNAGGKVKLSFAKSGGGLTVRNSEWAALAANCGTINIGFNNTTKVGGGGATPTVLLNANNGGYWSGAGAYVVHFKQLDNVGSYSNNYLQVEYYWSGAVANGGYPVLNIKTTWVNAWSNSWQDVVDGATSTSLVVSSPATTYLTNSWGTPTFGGSVAAV